jgi:hypothetical protein
MSYCRVSVCCGNVFTDPLPSNAYTRHYILRIEYTVLNRETKIMKMNTFAL